MRVYIRQRAVFLDPWYGMTVWMAAPPLTSGSTAEVRRTCSTGEFWRLSVRGGGRGKLDTKPEELGQCMANGGQEWLMV
jgi:hypothetical protein